MKTKKVSASAIKKKTYDWDDDSGLVALRKLDKTKRKGKGTNFRKMKEENFKWIARVILDAASVNSVPITDKLERIEAILRKEFKKERKGKGTNISIFLDWETLDWLDEQIKQRVFGNRSHAVQACLFNYKQHIHSTAYNKGKSAIRRIGERI